MRDLAIIFLRAVGFEHPEEWSAGALAVALKEVAELIKVDGEKRETFPVGTRVVIHDHTHAAPWTGTVVQYHSPYVIEVHDVHGEHWDVFAKDCKSLV